LIHSRKGFINACSNSYYASNLIEESATWRAIDKAADRIEMVTKKCDTGMVYTRVYSEFRKALSLWWERIDGNQECRDFALTQPTKRFQKYRTICGKEYSDTYLLDRVYFEMSAKSCHSEKYTSLFEMPRDSWMKAATLERILLNHRTFQEVYLFYTEALKAWVIDGWVDRDTKIILDSVTSNKIYLNTNDPQKAKIVKDYTTNAQVVDWFGDAMKWVDKVEYSKEPRLFYINGAFYRSQRPELINILKEKSPKSKIIMVLINLYSYGRQRNMDAHWNELHSLGIKKYYGFDCIKEAFSRLCDYPVKFYHYEDKGCQEKCLVVA
jgi:hypothetical protein